MSSRLVPAVSFEHVEAGWDHGISSSESAVFLRRLDGLDLFPNPQMVAYRKDKSLKDYLVRARIPLL